MLNFFLFSVGFAALIWSVPHIANSVSATILAVRVLRGTRKSGLQEVAKVIEAKTMREESSKLLAEIVRMTGEVKNPIQKIQVEKAACLATGNIEELTRIKTKLKTIVDAEKSAV